MTKRRRFPREPNSMIPRPEDLPYPPTHPQGQRGLSAIPQGPAAKLAPPTSGLGGWMAFTLFVGAARNDANEVQLEQLRTQVLPVVYELKREDLSADEVRAVIHSALFKTQLIMGAEWKPNEEFMKYIDKLTGKEVK